RINTHNDVIGVLVYDPMEEEIVKSNSLFFTDGVDTVDVDSSDKQFIQKYAERLSGREERFKHLSRKNGLPILSISTEYPVLDQLYEQLSIGRGKR
ncbi:MAG: hypothetical protein WBM70_10305, partial [Sulfurovum sp.]|uniref:hypothetical protein n=1 Tax=Sulfurovum sp. TaxID=1969726 RepID=UPI003C718044